MDDENVVDENKIIDLGGLEDDLDEEPALDTIPLGDEFTEDFEAETGSVNFHNEDTDKNY